jgi:hypothetical protein
MKRTIYKITVLNWSKYNGKLKKGHGCILLSTSFLSDPKIRNLSPTTKLLYLSCLLVCGESIRSKDDLSTESVKSQFEVTHDSLVFQSGVKSGSLQSQLDQLQSLQLLRYEKIEPLINRREEKRKESKRKEEKVPAGSKTDRQPPPKQEVLFDNEKSLNSKIWSSYFDAYLLRYKVEPKRNATVNGQVAQLGKRLGTEAIEVVAFYLSSNNGYYVQRCHPIGACLSDAESLRTQWMRGKPITRNDVRDFEKADKHASLIKDIRENGI